MRASVYVCVTGVSSSNCPNCSRLHGIVPLCVYVAYTCTCTCAHPKLKGMGGREGEREREREREIEINLPSPSRWLVLFPCSYYTCGYVAYMYMYMYM